MDGALIQGWSLNLLHVLQHLHMLFLPLCEPCIFLLPLEAHSLSFIKLLTPTAQAFLLMSEHLSWLFGI